MAGDAGLATTSAVKLESLALAGAGAGAKGSAKGSGGALAVAAAVAENTLKQNIETSLVNSSNLTTTNFGDISLAATDSSKITADGGGVAISLARGDPDASYGASTSAGSGSVGASVSTNTIGKSDSERHQVRAFVDNSSTLNAAGSVSITATSSPTIESLSIAGGLALTSAETSLAMSGTGAASYNNIYVETIASAGDATSIANTGTGKILAGNSITIRARDNATIDSVAVGANLSYAGGGGTGSKSYSIAIGVTISENTIYADVQAFVADMNEVTATTGDIVVKAEISAKAGEAESIQSLAVSVAIAMMAGEKGINLSAGGVKSTNSLLREVLAFISQTASVQCHPGCGQGPGN